MYGNALEWWTHEKMGLFKEISEKHCHVEDMLKEMRTKTQT